MLGKFRGDCTLGGVDRVTKGLALGASREALTLGSEENVVRVMSSD